LILGILKKLFCLLTIITASFLLIIPIQTSNAAESEEIPDWIKNNAGWWAEGKLTDESFILAIQWLINHSIISISPTAVEVEESQTFGYKIPDWIKNTAGWWTEGKIPDSEFISGLEWLTEHGIIVIRHGDVDPSNVIFSPMLAGTDQRNLEHIASTFFHIFGDLELIKVVDGKQYWGEIYLGLMDKRMVEYGEVSLWDDPQRAVVVYPAFTNAAYFTNGFYAYFRGECDTCTTTTIKDPVLSFATSGSAIQALTLMGYEVISDIAIDKNPNILKEYDKIILLHSEYVTRVMFDAITNHPNVIYLYPNALYAEIEVDYETNLITLIRGHGYPELEISNGFDWKFDNTHPYEYDTDCFNMEFYRIDNGWMTNCYPENVFGSSINGTYEILKALKGF
jgi:hypothetical protein